MAHAWAEAERQKQYLIEQMSAGNAPATPTVAIDSLVEAFVTSRQSQRIGDTTVKPHKRELNRLADFLEENGVFVPNAITAAALYKFRETWKTLYPASSTQREAQQRIRQFLRFLHDDGYLQKLKLPRLSPIKVDQPPTMPLDDKQYKALLGAIPKAFEHEGLARRMRAAVRPMRHSGLATGDAVTLKRDLFDKKKNVYRVVTSRQKSRNACVCADPG